MRTPLLLGALALGALTLPQAAQAQQFCFEFAGLFWTLELDNPTDTFTGVVSGGVPDWQVAGARGTNGRTIRHHTFTAINPALDNDPDCDDGTGFVDWLTYNGIVRGGSFPYTFEGNWYNSCDFTGSFSGPLTQGACPEPRVVESTLDSGVMVAASGTAAAQTAPEGYALTSSPNPFVRTATISYEIPRAANVRVTVYDVLGREVAVVVDAQQEAGAHTAVFDAATLPPGTYLYRIEAGAYAASKTMVLAR